MKRRWRYLFGAFLLAAGLLAGCADGVAPTQQPAQEQESDSRQEQEQEIAQEEGSRQEPEQEPAQEADSQQETAQEEEKEPETRILEEGTYTSKEEVAEYIAVYGHLPDNFITKKEAKALGWVSSEGNLAQAAPGKSIGGDYFGNFEGILPEKEGREYHECDIDSDGGYRGAKRIVYSNDGLVYYTEDHYETFELLYGEE